MAKKPLSTAEVTELVAGLHRLARNLWWTWDQEAQEVFSELSPRGWQNLYHNAVAILKEVSEPELRARLQDPDFAERVREVLKAFDAYMHDKLTWAQQHAPALASNPVAYFSAEFGFHETLPIAAGGLGILAGDHAKSASGLASECGARAGVFVGHESERERTAFPGFDAAGLWRGQHDANHAGDITRHWWGAIIAGVGNQALGVPHERGARGVSDAGVDSRE